MEMQVRAVIKKLKLRPHPEGGWYREIYRSDARVHTRRGIRSAITTIYYLLERGQISRWHVVDADEIWHFYEGSPLELLAYDPKRRALARSVLGATKDNRERVAVVRKGVWQAARSMGACSLVGCSVGPGFEFDGFRFVAQVRGSHAHFKGRLAPLASLL
jgi:predicted cupin superfamily sugar epimerase